jgi:AbiV family abortive infection protein
MENSKQTPLTVQEYGAQLLELVRGASLAFENAQDLYREASLLRGHGALSRALFLHQISLEECGKIEILGGWATSLLAGFEVNIGKLSGALARHKSKNYANAYMLPVTQAESRARADGDWDRAIEAFEELKEEFHHDSNTAKNAALYVDYESGRFSSPKEMTNEAMVAGISTLNAEFLSLVQPKVSMLSRWVNNPSEVQPMIAWFVSRAEELRGKRSGNPDEIMAILLREMVERARSSK